VQAYQIYLDEIKEYQKARDQQIADWLESENQKACVLGGVVAFD
jgi:hypothetical protein